MKYTEYKHKTPQRKKYKYTNTKYANVKHKIHETSEYNFHKDTKIHENPNHKQTQNAKT